jgi:hypothetical protein
MSTAVPSEPSRHGVPSDAVRRLGARITAGALALLLLGGSLPAGVRAVEPERGTSLPVGIGAIIGPAGERPYRVNLAGQRDFVAQRNFVQCVGASLQMMLNIVRPGIDRSARTQRSLQELARAWSGSRPDGMQRQGASFRGWTASLVIRGAGPYRAVGADTLQEAMRIAAIAIRTYQRPVGLLVWRGRHAWVMSGFETTADPAHVAGFKVRKAYVLDPLYPHGSSEWGSSPKPGTAIPVATVGRQFVPRRTGGMWSRIPSSIDLSGKYVLVVPSGPVHPGMD